MFSLNDQLVAKILDFVKAKPCQAKTGEDNKV